MRRLRDANIQGKRVLVRVDFNVPLNDKHTITDSTRIQGAMPTIEYITGKGGSVILMSHLGRPKGEYDENFSLKHLVNDLSVRLNKPVKFASDCIGKEATEKAHSLKSGEVLLLENLRFHPEEKANDAEFARKLAQLGDIYVNDAFGASHRAHASISAVADTFTDKYAGMLLQTEIENISAATENPASPSTLILGGAKVADKIGVIENFLPKIDNLVIGGGMAYTFIKAKGGNIGNSKLEEDKIDEAKRLLKMAKDNNVEVYLPKDSVVTDDIGNTENPETLSSYEIPDGKLGVDIGPEAREEYKQVIQNSKTIVWNGPMGIFEKEAFSEGTKAIGDEVAKMSGKGAFTMIGGGDTTATLSVLDIKPTFSHISTGGGALLEFLEGKQLPGILPIWTPGESYV